MRPELNIIDALGLACLIIAGACALAILFSIIDAIIFGHPKRGGDRTKK